MSSMGILADFCVHMFLCRFGWFMPNRTAASAGVVLDHWRALTSPDTAATFAPSPAQWEFIRQRLFTPDGR